jgi:hypothetical protein
MEEGEPGEDRSSLRGNPMALSGWLRKGGHGTSLFFNWAPGDRVRGVPKSFLIRCGKRNSKFEALNPKQIRMFQIQMFQTDKLLEFEPCLSPSPLGFESQRLVERAGVRGAIRYPPPPRSSPVRDCVVIFVKGRFGLGRQSRSSALGCGRLEL